MSVPMDQWGTPTLTADVAKATRFLLEKGQAGTFHATGPDYLSRLELAHRVCEHFRLETGLIRPVSTAQLHQVAKRPLRIHLDCAKLHHLGMEPFHDLEVGMNELEKWLATQEGW